MDEKCSSCGREIRKRVDWEGTCIEEGCEKLICKDCWKRGDVRCEDHKNAKSEERKEKVDPDDEERIRGFTLNYMNFIEDRFLRRKPLDWTVSEYLGKTKFKVRNRKYGEFEIVVFKKGLILKKKKIRVLIRPIIMLTGGLQRYVNEIVEAIKKGIYSIVVFVGDPESIKPEMTRFAESFSNDNMSIFAYDSLKNKLIFNAQNKTSEKYSSWFDPLKSPMNFMEILHSISESMSGKKVVSVEVVSKEFGMPKEYTEKILGKCGELKKIEETDSFILKEA